MNLIRSDGRYDRRAVMLDAHRIYRGMGPLGWDWAHCLRFAWARAKAMRERLAGEAGGGPRPARQSRECAA